MFFIPFKLAISSLGILTLAGSGAGALYILGDFGNTDAVDESEQKWEEFMKTRLTPDQWANRAELDGISQQVRESVELSNVKFWELIDKLIVKENKLSKNKSAVLSILKLMWDNRDNLKNIENKLKEEVPSWKLNIEELNETLNFENPDKFLESLEKYLTSKT